MEPLINIAIDAARRGGQIIVSHLSQLKYLKISSKAADELVSEVDIKAEEAIINTIHKAYPKHGILAEESGETPGKEDTLWIIDPLDGTHNYLHDFPNFAISIGIKQKGRLMHGLIFDPLRQEFFTASRGRGAYLNEQQRLRVGHATSLDNAMLMTGFPHRGKNITSDYLLGFQAMYQHTTSIRCLGSAALSMAYVASGRVDGYWQYHLKPWDIAAGTLLLRESGALISDFQGSEDFLTNGNVVCGNPKIFKAMLQNLQASTQKK